MLCLFPLPSSSSSSSFFSSFAFLLHFLLIPPPPPFLPCSRFPTCNKSLQCLCPSASSLLLLLIIISIFLIIVALPLLFLPVFLLFFRFIFHSLFAPSQSLRPIPSSFHVSPFPHHHISPHLSSHYLLFNLFFPHFSRPPQFSPLTRFTSSMFFLLIFSSSSMSFLPIFLIFFISLLHLPYTPVHFTFLIFFLLHVHILPLQRLLHLHLFPPSFIPCFTFLGQILLPFLSLSSVSVLGARICSVSIVLFPSFVSQTSLLFLSPTSSVLAFLCLPSFVLCSWVRCTGVIRSSMIKLKEEGSFSMIRGRRKDGSLDIPALDTGTFFPDLWPV